MASSSSTGQLSNKDRIPQEIRGRMTWDPKFKEQVRNQYADGSDGYVSDDDESDDFDYDYPTAPYVSGGTQANVHSVDPCTSQNTPQHPTKNASSNQAALKNASQNSIRSDGFQRVSYQRFHKIHDQAKGKQAQKPRIPRRVNLNFNEDNFAKACFRKRDDPTGKFLLHKDCNEIEPDKVKMYDYLEELGVRVGSFIRPPQHNKDRTLLLWGKSEAIEKTIHELQEWLHPSRPMRATVSEPSKPRGGDYFAKVYSKKGDHDRREQDAIQKKAELYKFQQVPAKGQIFSFTGTFLWPVKEIRPQDILGDGLEALDPVRLSYKCHIIFDDKQLVFKILTNNKSSVARTLPRIEGIMKEYVARSLRPITKYYIKPPVPSCYRKDIKITPYGSPSPNANVPRIPSLIGRALQLDEYAHWSQQSADLIAQSNRGIEDALLKTIPNLAVYRGKVQMRVQFGTFGLTVFQWPGAVTSIPFEDFTKNIAVPGTKGTMIRDLGVKKDTLAILEKIYTASHFLQPIDNQIMTLADVIPSVTAYFECQEDDKGPMKLEVEMSANALDRLLYEKTHVSWSRLGRGGNAIPLDIFVMRLDSGPSWRLRASAENNIDSSRISPRMARFADSVRLAQVPSSAVELTGAKSFYWDKNPGSLMVTSFLQKSSLRFRLVKNMDYIIEISRYDAYGQQGEEDTIRQTTWAASLWNEEWDAVLMANGSLGIGESANWEPTLRTFFPGLPSVSHQAINRGVMDFLRIVGEVNEFLGDIKKQPPHLRI